VKHRAPVVAPSARCHSTWWTTGSLCTLEAARCVSKKYEDHSLGLAGATQLLCPDARQERVHGAVVANAQKTPERFLAWVALQHEEVVCFCATPEEVLPGLAKSRCNVEAFRERMLLCSFVLPPDVS